MTRGVAIVDWRSLYGISRSSRTQSSAAGRAVCAPLASISWLPRPVLANVRDHSPHLAFGRNTSASSRHFAPLGAAIRPCRGAVRREGPLPLHRGSGAWRVSPGVRAPRLGSGIACGSTKDGSSQLAELDPNVAEAGGPKPGRHVVRVARHVGVTTVEFVELAGVDGVASDEQPTRPQDPTQLDQQPILQLPGRNMMQHRERRGGAEPAGLSGNRVASAWTTCTLLSRRRSRREPARSGSISTAVSRGTRRRRTWVVSPGPEPTSSTSSPSRDRRPPTAGSRSRRCRPTPGWRRTPDAAGSSASLPPGPAATSSRPPSTFSNQWWA